MSQLVLIRPGCTLFDEENRIQGTLDMPLCPRGQTQVQKLVEEVRSQDLEILYTSPTNPARETATLIGQDMGIPVKELEGLSNLNHGLWQGLTVEEIKRKHPKVFKQWHETPESVCPPDGETISQAEERIFRALEKPVKRGISMGVVVSEPLAALIASVLKNTKFVLPNPCQLGKCEHHWEAFPMEKAREAFMQRFGMGQSSWELVIPRLEKPE